MTRRKENTACRFFHSCLFQRHTINLNKSQTRPHNQGNQYQPVAGDIALFLGVSSIEPETDAEDGNTLCNDSSGDDAAWVVVGLDIHNAAPKFQGEGQGK